MSANVDDYYSKMSSDSSDDSKTTKKKPIIKKKIIVKAKKVAQTVEPKKEVVQETTSSEVSSSSMETDTSTQFQKTPTKTSQSLNDVIVASKPKKSGFTVVRRAETHSNDARSSGVLNTSKTTPTYKTRGADTSQL